LAAVVALDEVEFVVVARAMIDMMMMKKLVD
jgi:hypothetical protein